jgi:hypothetical protein
MDGFSAILLICGLVVALGFISFGIYDIAHDRTGRGIALIVARPFRLRARRRVSRPAHHGRRHLFRHMGTQRLTPSPKQSQSARLE